MKKLFIVVLLIVGLLIPAVSAETLIIDIDDQDSISNNDVYTGGTKRTLLGGDSGLRGVGIYVKQIETVTDPYSLVYFFDGSENWLHISDPDIRYDSSEFTASISGQLVATGTITYNLYPGSDAGYIVVDFDTWTPGDLTGNKYMSINPKNGLNGMRLLGYSGGSGEGNNQILLTQIATKYTGTWGFIDDPYIASGTHTLNIIKSFKSQITGNIDENGGYEVVVTTDIKYPSTVKISPKYNNEYITVIEKTNEPLVRYIGSPEYKPIKVEIYSHLLDKWYTNFLFNDVEEPEEPIEDSGLTVYIKNSQTGALIANANIVIDALVDGEYYPVTNRTEPSGIFTITLQPTGGGKPNPDGYRLIVTADGYNNPMPEINFTVDDYKNYIHCLLDPIAGGPVNENKTFIDFFVRDMTSNPISGATVKFGKYTLITNSAGYTVFEVDKNNNYSWTVSKSGYGALTGNAVIGNDPRHTINTVLAPIVTPTTTTPIPTSPPIGPTSTMTAPTGEPVSNWLEWFAAHFGMILGGGVEIGKIFMWLCFTVPVGVYVGKESKAGAAGFMAGAGIVTLFFVLIGWVPIWLVVLLALIIGLLYAKEFNAPDNGGGR